MSKVPLILTQRSWVKISISLSTNKVYYFRPINPDFRTRLLGATSNYFKRKKSENFLLGLVHLI